jgi:hypothetical protein
VQPAQLLVQVDQPGRDARQPAAALIGGIGHVHRIGDGLEEGLEAALGHALFAQLVKPLLGLGDLVARLAVDTSTFCARSAMSRPSWISSRRTARS